MGIDIMWLLLVLPVYSGFHLCFAAIFICLDLLWFCVQKLNI